MAILRMLDLSTAHITPATDELLRAEARGEDALSFPVYGKGDVGYYIYALDTELDDAPADLLQVLRYAQEQDCSLVCLDSGAEILDALPDYTEEWERWEERNKGNIGE